jgi:mRNA interferase MazF
VVTIKTSLSLQKTLFDQAELLAQRLNISQNHVFEMAIENFIREAQSQNLPDDIDQPDPNTQLTVSLPIGSARQAINQGEIYWVQLEHSIDIEPGIPHPHVVIQEDVFNHSRLETVIVCALTSNIKRVNMPGNVLLDIGEANLSRQSVVEVSKVSTVDKTRLGGYIGSLSEHRIAQILAGMRFLQTSFFARSDDSQ